MNVDTQLVYTPDTSTSAGPAKIAPEQLSSRPPEQPTRSAAPETRTEQDKPDRKTAAEPPQPATVQTDYSTRNQPGELLDVIV